MINVIVAVSQGMRKGFKEEGVEIDLGQCGRGWRNGKNTTKDDHEGAGLENEYECVCGREKPYRAELQEKESQPGGRQIDSSHEPHNKQTLFLSAQFTSAAA